MTDRLLSINVGGPRELSWRGRTVRTAVYKEPVPGARMVRRTNIDGDDQADRLAHGGEHRAVFVYQIGSYRYWEQVLGRDDFGYGQFGENFTVEGLPDDEVCIGDRYRIGQAEFEVTQPRVTCYRVGIRLDVPEMPTLLVTHHRPGFYLRVLQEGLVEAGQEIVKTGEAEQRLTVADVDALLYLPGRSRATLRRAVAIPALSRGWHDSFQALLDQAPDEAASRPAWEGFRPMRVMAKQAESSTISSFRLLPADGDAVPAADPGQYLTLRLQPDAEAHPVLRSYSMSGPPDPQAGYRVSVKLEPGGSASGLLHRTVQVGDLVEVAAPRGQFTLRPGERPVVLVSAGVGATPVLAMLHSLALRRDTRAVWWVHGARDDAEQAFAAEVDELLARLPDAHRLVAHSRPRPGAGGRPDVVGRLDAGVLEDAAVPFDADFYLCGPAGFLRDLGAGLAARGVPPERVAVEVFGSQGATTSGIVATGTPRAPHPPPGAQPPGSGPAVSFVRSRLTVPWDARSGTLLELAEACDVPVRFSCRNGTCHTCESTVLDGRVTYSSEPLERPHDGRALICCSTPVTDLALDL
ncbi:ferredoxin-NADP reductase [Geodermatophilus tzadiensis]|uniref:Ferredoxin-NADP reductase n=1 Tax=Geodermatophilus tzadiensis TaxID=1137988 RepID=A0A2T0TTQ4_9ACTN|nr:MOSC and FAD-binding oxidoreductase domain-containing protein [Geodermatophilus tzadiensis]PRY49031.1 ferredoxin-NADP reductase [Geodermatophilus tzadiensis]